MYWSRTGSVFDLVVVVLLVLMWGLGGWLLIRSVASLRPRERLIAGLGVGLVLFMVFGNLLAQLVAFQASVWLASGLILLLGITAALRARPSPRELMADFEGWPLLVALGGLTLVFALINRGLGIFDDYHNLPIVSLMATGDVPPHFYLNPALRLAYHYGLHEIAAAFLVPGGMLPWSAFDLTKALSLGLTLVLAWLWFRRVTGSETAAAVGVVLLALASGTRWVLLFASPGWLGSVGETLELLGSARSTGPDLFTNLTLDWNIEGGGPVAFPFAFLSGIFNPYVLAIGGSGAMPLVILLLMLLIFREGLSWAETLLLGLLLGGLALTSEVLFGLVWGGLAVGALFHFLLKRPRLSRSSDMSNWLFILGLSAVMALVQGGVFTELARGVVCFSDCSAGGSAGFDGFSLSWPPAIVSAHLGPLALMNISQLAIGILEVGPVLLLGPVILVWGWRRLKAGDVFIGGLAIFSVVVFIVPLFFTYGVTRDTGRIGGMALRVWLLLGIPLVWEAYQRGSKAGRVAIAGLAAAAVFGGIVLFGIELIAIPLPVQSYFADGSDARMSARFWDTLEPDAQVVDRLPYRGASVFGRAVTSHESLRESLPVWEALIDDLTPAEAAAAGYDYIYVDERTWRRLDDEQREAYGADCAVLLHEELGPRNTFRWLYDVGDCG